MAHVTDLSPRQRRILEQVRDELTCAPSVQEARDRLGAWGTLRPRQWYNVLGPGARHLRVLGRRITAPLANPDLRPVAFAIRHATPLNYVNGVLGELLAWVILLVSVLFLAVASLVLLLIALAAAFRLNAGAVVSVLRLVPKLHEQLQRRRQRFERGRWAGRRLRYNSYLRLREDERAPVLYLRSFSFDYVDELPAEDTRRADERLAEMYEGYGPVIAVAGPDDKGPMLGPVRLYFDDDIWRAAVVYLISISQRVVVQAGISQGTLWELGVARRTLRPEQLIISVVDASDPSMGDKFYHEFKNFAELILDCRLPTWLGSSLFISFDRDWQPLLRGPRGEWLPPPAPSVHRRRAPAPRRPAGATPSHIVKDGYKKCPYCRLNNVLEAFACERCGRVLVGL